MHITIWIDEITVENVTEKINEKVQEVENESYQIKTMSFWGTDKVVLIKKRTKRNVISDFFFCSGLIFNY